MTSPVNTTQLMAGPISVYHGLFGAAEPATAVTAIATPPWTLMGGTIGGATLTLGQTYRNQTVDQVPMPVAGQLTGQEATVATQLMEVTLENLRRALNQASAPTSDVVEFGGEDIVNSDVLYSAILMKGRKPGTSTPRLWVLRKTLSTASVGIPFQKDGDTVYPVTWSGFYVSASIKAVKIYENTV